MLLCLVVSLGILALRGCFYAKQERAPSLRYTEARHTGREEQEVLLYDAEAGKTERLKLETYLLGVVAAEMPAGFHEEALCAQAVAARTYTLKRMQTGPCGTSGCDVCTDSSCCQAYDNDAACREKWGENYTTYAGKIRSAVEKTKGEVLLYQGELIEALYHAAAGGHTEDSENVFASAQPYLRGVKSDVETGTSHLADTERLSRRTFAERVNRACPEAGLKAARLEEQVQVEARYDSGRVERIRLGKATLTGREFRSLLELKSAMFTVEFTGEDVIIHTRGHGHGVGMSQAGANGLAEQGMTYREILAHYYTGTEISGI